MSSLGYILEEIQGLTITITGNTLTSFTAISSSAITNNVDTLYTFGIGNNAALNNGYSIQIIFPTDFKFLNYSSMVCTVAGSAIPCGRLNSTFGSTTHTVFISINSTVATIGSATVSSVTNPQAQLTTGSFSTSIVDAEGTVVESSNQAPTVTLSGTNSFSSFLATTYNISSASTTR